MKRLKSKLLSMDANTTTYREIYEGSMLVSDPNYPTIEPYVDYSSTYYDDAIAYEISATHKLAQDKPTVLICIPCSLLGLNVPERWASCAVADYCLRAFLPYIDELNEQLYNRSRPEKETGKYYISVPGGEILQRNTAYFAMCPRKDYTYGPGSVVYLLSEGEAQSLVMCLCLRIQVQLPFRKLRRAVQMMCRDLPDAVERYISCFNIEEMHKVTDLARKQAAIRAWLNKSEYCVFIANGSILPREKGSDKPQKDAVPFQSVPADEIEVCGVKGMGIKKGVTVITGGGYSGKSTLLDSIAAGVYDHTLGDGRELCITDESAVTICAEDGRSVKHINISPFIRWLPSGDAVDFSTDQASGSTSQAANIMEAVDSDAKLLLIDEDRSATNFMIRDQMMKALIEKEPITPFTDRVNELFETKGVSTVLVIGGSGEYLSVADKIYMMEDYQIYDVTKQAKQICCFCGVNSNDSEPIEWEQHRCFYSEGFSSFPKGSGTEKLAVLDMGFICIGDEVVDVRSLHNIVSVRQLNALGFMLRHLEITNNDRIINIKKRIEELYARIEEEGLDFLYSSFFTTCERFLDLPRKQELLALINRMRRIHIVKKGDGDIP